MYLIQNQVLIRLYLDMLGRSGYIMPTYSWSNLKPKLAKEPSRGVSRLTHQIDLVLVPWPKSFTRQHIQFTIFMFFFNEFMSKLL